MEVRTKDPLGQLGDCVEDQVSGRSQAQVWDQIEGQAENGLWRYVRETLNKYASN